MLASFKKKFIVDVKRALRLGALLIFIASFCCYSVMLAEFAKFSESPRPSNGETLQQPFLKGTGGSDNFRIPAMVTLDDGSIITAADARWNHLQDSSGLDTIVSVSQDNGNTWRYTFANYFGDNGNVRNDGSTCFIDPALATDGTTAYMIVDVNPSGYATNSSTYVPLKGKTGFDDQNRLLLREKDSVKLDFGSLSYGLACHLAPYDYYLDYLDDTKSKYGIFVRESGERVEGYEVDLFFNVSYYEGGEKMTSNLFYFTSPFQVYPAPYLYLTSTTDGINWSAPTLLNLKRGEEESLLVGPGNGVYDEKNDRLVFTAYYHNWNQPEYASLIWRDGNGVWHRSENITTKSWSSESSAVLLDDGRLRVFYRGGEEVLCYTDMVFDETRGNYFRDPNASEIKTSATKTANCQLSALLYKQTYGGKQWIFVSAPTGANRKRIDGVVHGFTLEEDGSMTYIASRTVKEGSFAYSCLTELNDGHLAILYEGEAGEILFEKINVTWFWDKFNEKQEG